MLFKTKSDFKKAINGEDFAKIDAYLAKSPEAAQHWLGMSLDDNNNTALHFAARKRTPALLNKLLSYKPRLDQLNGSEQPPLFIAVYNSNVLTTEALLKNGADPNVQVGIYDTPLRQAFKNKAYSLAKILLDHQAKPQIWSYFEQAISHDDMTIHKMLIDAGADITQFKTMMHVAAESGSSKIVQDLLERGWDINRQDSKMRTPLHKAVYANKLAVVKLLVREGASLDIEDKEGHSVREWIKSQKADRTINTFINELQKDGAEKATPSLPASSSNEAWHLISPTKVAKSGSYPEIQKKLTEIFNFETQDHMTIVDDLATHMQTVLPVEKFSQMTEMALTGAYEAYRAAGGQIEEKQAFRDLTFSGGVSYVRKSGM